MTRALCVASIAILPAANLWQEPARPLTARTAVVAIYVTVAGADGHLVSDVERGEFTVLDNGRPRPLTVFDNSPQAITIVAMLDVSGSMLGNMPVLQAAAGQFFARLRPGDRARVGSFGDKVRVSGAFSDDATVLASALHAELKPGGATPLWSAVDTAMTAMQPIDGRRVVLVLSDGHDTGLWENGKKIGPTDTDVLTRARAQDFMIYAIGMRSRGAPASPGLPVPKFPSDRPDPWLRTLAEQTGGGYFELIGSEDLGTVFARVADELRRQYVLGILAGEADGLEHALDVRVTRPGVTVRARRSYVAPRPERPPS